MNREPAQIEALVREALAPFVGQIARKETPEQMREALLTHPELSAAASRVGYRVFFS